MTLRGGNPQALMLPSQCLHHYQVDSHADAACATAAVPGKTARLRQWLGAVVRRDKRAG